MSGVDPDFGLNNFGASKMFNETETVVNNILMLLFLRPGGYPSLPHIGMYVQQYLYQFYDEIDPDDIKVRLVSQCEEFLPQVLRGEFDVKKGMVDGNAFLLLILPVKIDDRVSDLVIGLKSDASGNIVYNYKIDKQA